MREKDEEQLEARLRHRFLRPELLARALTHRSALGETRSRGIGEGEETVPADNERLEFLGDAVLALLVSEYLHESFPEWTEGQLSRSRARLVNAQSLGTAARRLELGRYLRLSRGEEKTGGRTKPALLADAFEAVIGAIYLDGGLGAARDFLERTLLETAAIKTDRERLAETDRKSALQEFLQGRGRPPAHYRVTGESGPDHQKWFQVEVWIEGARLATGQGRTKREAEQQAANRALELLETSESPG